ncbi:uncharacterized protein LOC117291943 [Asterias rubens]|uniref:Orexin-type 2 n=1 Tax=Asterias rubens TaxID=7604 RepID=A0A0U2IWK5_ASTRU|nr:uncharacterized protein LOC117291943 [Asterias rubens]ALJ99960.1 orexin-type precursor 2 [Asterias rubens]
MRTTTLFVIQTVVVIGYFTCSSTAAANACCRGTCHDIPPGCNCPYKSYLCGELNALTMGKRKADDTSYLLTQEQETQQQNQQRRTQQTQPWVDRQPDDDRIVDVLNNLLKLFKETHQGDQDGFDLQDQSDDWEPVTSSRKQQSENAHNVYRHQPLFSADIL